MTTAEEMKIITEESEAAITNTLKGVLDACISAARHGEFQRRFENGFPGANDNAVTSRLKTLGYSVHVAIGRYDLIVNWARDNHHG